MSRWIAPVVAVVLAALAAGGLPTAGGLGLSAAQEASPAATSCLATTEAENTALLRRLFEEGWGQGALQVVDEVMADDVIVHRAAISAVSIPPTTYATPGPAAYAAGIQVLRTDLPDLQVTIEDVIAAGDQVALRSTFAGTQANPIENLGAPNTGRPVAFEAWVFARVDCGQVAELWLLTDNLAAMRQLGIISDEELRDAGTPTVATPVP